MYTGIINHLGKILAIKVIAKGLRLTIATEFTDFEMGESIALDGICVTVVAFREGQFDCELSPETLKLTTANSFKVGTEVNLERSLTLNERFGGHFVMGHVDTVLQVKTIEKQAEFTRMVFKGLTNDNKAYFAKKGSACINGISLTINEIYEDGFEVMLIPHTQERTNLKHLNENDFVNIEYDTIARIVVHQLNLTQTQNEA